MEEDIQELIEELGQLAVKFSEGWHEGIKIDASDIMLMNRAANALSDMDAKLKEKTS
jgi:predicted ribosome quality control (RQC) complex YloA/Tae2 family protein